MFTFLYLEEYFDNTWQGNALCWKMKLRKSVNFPTDIEAQIREIQGKKAALDEAQGVGLDSTGYYDQEIYGGSDSRFAGYVTSIAATELEDVSYKVYKSQTFFDGE